MSEQNAPEKRTVSEELEMVGGQVLERLQELIKEGNVRRVIVRTQDNKVLIDTTLTVGALAGGALALITGPFLIALAGLAAVAGRVKVEIVREIEDDADMKTRIQINSEE